MKRLHLRRLTGSSLIEILIATLVVGLVLTSIAFLMSMNVKSSTEAELRSQASVFAQQGVEVVRNYRVSHTWSQFLTNTALTTPGGSACIKADLNFANTVFSRTCVFSSVSASDPRTTLTVTVTWPASAPAANQSNVIIRQRFYNR